MHYENMPIQFTGIQIEIFNGKNVFLIFSLKTYNVGTCKNRLADAVLTSTHIINMFGVKNKEIRYTPANPSFSM